MHEVLVETVIPAPAEEIFEILGDHAAYARFDGIASATLLRPGQSEPSGVGALREIRAGLRFVEEITRFERPGRMDYVIRECSIPIDHEGGSIELSDDPEGTRVVWRSRFRVRIPLLGGLIGRIVRPRLEAAFVGMLEEVSAATSSRP